MFFPSTLPNKLFKNDLSSYLVISNIFVVSAYNLYRF